MFFVAVYSSETTLNSVPGLPSCRLSYLYIGLFSGQKVTSSSFQNPQSKFIPSPDTLSSFENNSSLKAIDSSSLIMLFILLHQHSRLMQLSLIS